MITSFDTSTFVPLVIAEPTSAMCRRSWDLADEVVVTRLLYVKTGAALHQAHRAGRISDLSLRRAWQAVDDLWSQVAVVELDETLMISPAGLAGSLALRGYGAVHCAAGLLLVGEPQAVATSGDRQLLNAWRHLEVSVLDVTAG